MTEPLDCADARSHGSRRRARVDAVCARPCTSRRRRRGRAYGRNNGHRRRREKASEAALGEPTATATATATRCSAHVRRVATEAGHGLDLALPPDDVRAEVGEGEIFHEASQSFETRDARGSLTALLKPPFSARQRQRQRRPPAATADPGRLRIAPEVESELEPHEISLPDVAGWQCERAPERPRDRPIRITRTGDRGGAVADDRQARPRPQAARVPPRRRRARLDHRRRARALDVYRRPRGLRHPPDRGAHRRREGRPFEDLEIEVEVEVAQLFGESRGPPTASGAAWRRL